MQKILEEFENRVVAQVAKDLIDGGFRLFVCDSYEETPPLIEIKTADEAAFMLRDYDFDCGADLLLVKPGESIPNLVEDEKFDAFVRFVFGNSGWDVISDYTPSIESHLKNAQELCDKYMD